MRFEARGRIGVSPARLWPLVSDTQRLNKVLGLPVIRFRTEPLPAGGSRVVGEHPIGSAALSLLGQALPGLAARAHDERLLGRLPGFPVVCWIEHPFEWEIPRRYAVRRDYFWSLLGLFPFRTFYGGVELIPTGDGGTEVLVFAEIEPRNLLGTLLTRLVLGPGHVQAVIQQCRLFEEHLLGKIPDPFPQLVPQVRGPAAGASPSEAAPPAPPAPEVVPEPQGTLPPAVPPASTGAVPGAPQQFRRTLQRATEVPPASTGAVRAAGNGHGGWVALARAGVRPELIERLRRHLQDAPDEDVQKMRPFELADRWGIDRRETLAAFLHATTAGLLAMTWDILCPNCRIATASFGSLSELQGEGHCNYCNVTFDATFDRQVEVRFSVAVSIRTVAGQRFCSGGPASLPHIVVQTTLAPGEEKVLDLVLSAGAYRLRSPQCRTTAVVEVLDQPPQSESNGTLAVALAPDALRPPLLAAASGPLRCRFRNETAVEALLAIERPEWPDTAATAAYIGTLQEFRDLFGTEALAPGLQLAIQRLAFLFTDLTGSTALYQAVGQARAFRLVQDHFEILGRVIASHRGAVVKTIGDAVMATFPTGADAFDAALAMQQAIRQLDTGGAVDTTRLLKIGIHEGPCIAVGANGRLDYFGTTINLAARVQSESRGGEVVLSAEVYQDPFVQERLRHDGLAVAEAETHLRGIREPVRLYRLIDPIRA